MFGANEQRKEQHCNFNLQIIPTLQALKTQMIMLCRPINLHVRSVVVWPVNQNSIWCPRKNYECNRSLNAKFMGVRNRVNNTIKPHGYRSRLLESRRYQNKKNWFIQVVNHGIDVVVAVFVLVLTKDHIAADLNCNIMLQKAESNLEWLEIHVLIMSPTVNLDFKVNLYINHFLFFVWSEWKSNLIEVNRYVIWPN